MKNVLNLFTLVEVRNKSSNKWESLKESDFYESNVCERYRTTKDYKNIKIRTFECSETLMIDLFTEENFPSKINQYKSEDVLPENDYYHFFIHWNDLKRLNYIAFEDVLKFDYKKNINPNVYRQKNKWQHKCLDCEFLAKKNSSDKNLTYENYLGKRFFEDLENLKKIGKPSDIRICFFIDDILK
jgi:hypothetical protein